MLDPQKTRVIAKAAADARRELERLGRPSGDFDAGRYFRGSGELRFHNVGTTPMRALARSIHAEHQHEWSIDEAMAFANRLIEDQHLEAKAVGVEVVARYRRDFTPRLLPAWKRWLALNHAANWATTDHICCYLLGPLLVSSPNLAAQMRDWAGHRNLWVRRAAAAGLIPSVRQGLALNVAYDVARRLHPDPNDLIHKAVGWMLRESGKTDVARLERYLRASGASMPRTTVRYAIERFPPEKRRELLDATRAPIIARAKRRAS